MSWNDDYDVDSESLNENEDVEVRICAGYGCVFIPDEEGEEFCIDCRDDA